MLNIYFEFYSIKYANMLKFTGFQTAYGGCGACESATSFAQQSTTPPWQPYSRMHSGPLFHQHKWKLRSWRKHLALNTGKVDYNVPRLW